MSYCLKTKSIWGYPNQRFFRFLNMISKSGLPKTLCIIGCSDGRYVIPAAKRGFKFRAIDMDNKAIFGGVINKNQKTLEIEGLLSRVCKERVSKLVKIVPKDFMKDKCKKKYSGVFTSGSIHYDENKIYTPQSIIDKIKSYVSIGVFLLIEYIYRSEFRKDLSKHYFTKEEMENLFRDNSFKITSHKLKRYIEPPNPANPLVHKIDRARLYAIRLS